MNSKPSPADAIHVFDRNLLRARRDRAASSIGDYDFLLQEVAGHLTERLDLIKKEFPVMVDLGAYHGVLAEKLKQRKGTQFVAACDMSTQMLAGISVPSFTADEEILPLRTQSIDAIVSNLSLQWVNDLPGALLQIKQALKPDGMFMCAVLGGESLTELRQSLMEAEMKITGGVSPRVSPFIDMRDMGALMQRAGYALPVIDNDKIIVDYSHPLRLMRDLRGMGAANATNNRLKLPTRRAVLLEAAKIYQEKFGDNAGRVPATFDIIYAIGWAPHDSQQKPLKPGNATVRLADQLQSAEQSADEKARP